jgi:SAM-dependent methyltransferase
MAIAHVAIGLAGEPKGPDDGRVATAPASEFVEYVPTPPRVVAKMIQAANVREHDVVYDLGCGDGRLLIEAARNHGARCVGCDLDPARVAEARANVVDAGVEALVTIEHADLFEMDLRPASVVFVYLLPTVLARLLPQFARLAPGSRIVSHDYDIEGFDYDDVWVLQAEHHRLHPKVRQHVVLLWTTPLEPSPRTG